MEGIDTNQLDTGAYRPLRALKAVKGMAPATDLGKRAELCLLPLDRLVVDERYQRPITDKGRVNVSRIVACFNWRQFTPVIVVPAGGGLLCHHRRPAPGHGGAHAS